MLKLTIEELSALNLLFNFITVKELIAAAGYGFAELETEIKGEEKADLCWKVSTTLP